MATVLSPSASTHRTIAPLLSGTTESDSVTSPVAGGVYGPGVDSARMDAIRVRVERVDLSVTFSLGRFISDWQSAQRTFIAGIVREYGALFPTRSQDFVANPSPLLSESWCRYMILGNTAHISLCPDSLQLDFTGLRQEDVSTTARALLYGAARLLSTDFNEFGRGSTVFTTNGHLQILDENVEADAYLVQFVQPRAVDVVESEADLVYQPSSSIRFTDKENKFTFRHSIEKSDWLENGLFVTAQIFMSPDEGLTLENQVNLIARIEELADRATGLTYQKVKDDDVSR